MWISIVLSFVFAQEFAIQNAKEIEVLGAKIQIELTSTAGSNLLWACDTECQVKPELKGDRLLVRISSLELVRLQVPFKIIAVYSNEAQIKTKDLTASLKGRFTTVNLQSQNGIGELDIVANKADIRVVKHQGKLNFDIFEGNLQVAGSQGEILASQFTGKQIFVGTEGNLHLSTQKADTLIKNGQGKLKYKSVKGKMDLLSYQGEIQGESQAGSSTLIPSLKSKLTWKANQGEVQVKVPNGAALDIGTKEGNMQLIPTLKAKLEGDWKVARAKVSEPDAGSILVRTNKASIRVRSE